MENLKMPSSAYQRLRGLMDDDPPKTLSVGEKLKIAIQLSELGIAMKKQQIRNQNPLLSETQQREMFEEWLLRRPSSPFGDSSGRPRPAL